MPSERTFLSLPLEKLNTSFDEGGEKNHGGKRKGKTEWTGTFPFFQAKKRPIYFRRFIRISKSPRAFVSVASIWVRPETRVISISSVCSFPPSVLRQEKIKCGEKVEGTLNS